MLKLIDRSNIYIFKFDIQVSKCTLSNTFIAENKLLVYTRNDPYSNICTVNENKIRTRRSFKFQCAQTDYQCNFGYHQDFGTKLCVNDRHTTKLNVCFNGIMQTIDPDAYERLYSQKYYDDYCFTHIMVNRSSVNTSCRFIEHNLRRHMKTDNTS
ncbi:hypothetical protein A3Q56_03781 [Intoshia linei]|uniref:Uncharacterized protein n=1 Tax=Intoshia linei TaxID=1819745 RepID=A0A177B2H7_9BILA|nr:hypothetical protein A3Q56_03781 [Intoshia linei]